MTLTNTTQPDAALMAAAREDATAFDAIYRRYATRVYRYCFARTNNAQVAEDLTAQTFLAALEGIGRFRGDGSVAAWLFGIAANVCKGYYRYQRRHPQAPLETVSERTDVHMPDLERHTYRRSILNCALRVLPELSEERQEVLRLRFLAELDTAETAAVMGKRRGAVRKLLSRAVDDLRKRCLDE